MKKTYLSFISIFIIIAYCNLNAQTWSTVGSGMNEVIHAFAVYNGELYAGGSFTTAGGITANHIAKWNGTTWSAVGDGTNNPILTLAVYNGELYAGGIFTTAGNVPANYIAKWNGTTWSSVGGSVNAGVYALAVYTGELYAGGLFNTAGNVSANYIAKWNGTTWSALGNGLNDYVQKNCLCVYNGELYVAGVFNMAGGIWANHLAKWDGTSWSAVGGGTNNPVLALAVFNDGLYAGGNFTIAGGISASHMARWNGITWSALGSGTTWTVFALQTFAGELYAGGSFDYPANYIARWNGTNWSALGNGLNGPVLGLGVFNNELYVGGFFTTAGDISANHIAKWSNCSSAPIQPGFITGNTSVCSNSTQHFSVSSVVGASGYTWTLPSGWTGTSTTNSITVMVGSNSGNISVTANNNCGNGLAQTLSVMVNRAPSQPGSIIGDTLANIGQTFNYSTNSSGDATGYEWSLSGGGVISSGQNTASVSVNWLTAGNYTLSVSATNICGISTARILNISVSTKPDNPFEISVMPNPTMGEIYLTAKGVINKVIQIEIVSLSGQLLHKSQQTGRTNNYLQILELKNAAVGVYVVKVCIDNRRYLRPVVKLN